MSLIDWFAARRKDQFVGKVSQDTDEGDGLWVKCSECSQVAYRKDLISNFNVCSNCGHHNRINSDERINIIADKNSFEEFDNSLSPSVTKYFTMLHIINLQAATSTLRKKNWS